MILVRPVAGTVVECGGNLAATYLARGWRDANAPVEPVEVLTEKPKRAPRRARNND